jgi:hypothetical protein
MTMLRNKVFLFLFLSLSSLLSIFLRLFMNSLGNYALKIIWKSSLFWLPPEVKKRKKEKKKRKLKNFRFTLGLQK